MPPPWSLANSPAVDMGLAVACAAALFFPGLALLRLAGSPSRGLERAALAVGLSIAAAPLALLGTSLAGVAWSRGRVVAVVIVLGALALAPRAGRARGLASDRPAPELPDAPTWAALAVLATALVGRAVQARGVALPLWVDGYHHTLIVELILRAGAVPEGFRPFVDVDGFYYHFGFHALAAEVGWLAGAPSPRATLWVGQALAAATALTLWLLALRLTGSRWAAAAAAAVPAGLYHFPAYFLTWGRYTQLAALAVLPVAVCLLADAVGGQRRGRPAAIALAAIAAAGLVLAHYRVAVLYGACALVVGAGALRAPDRVARLGRLGAVAACAGLLAGPWLLGPLRLGAGHLAEATQAAGTDRAWWSWSGEVNDVPAWLFTIRWNDAVLATAAAGLITGLALGRRGAAAVLGALALAGIAFAPEALGLPATWMLPRFAAAISAFVPAALGVGFLADAAERAATVASRRWPRLAGAHARRAARVGAAALVAGSALAGAVAMRDIVNRVTVIASAADLGAYGWIREHVPAEARFLVRAAPWHLGTCRGIDGGYWLPLMTGHATTMPASFYAYGEVADVRAIGEACAEAARADAIGRGELGALLDRTGATWLYVGPSPADGPSGWSAERLRAQDGLVEAYDDGAVAIFCRAGAAGCEAP